MDVLRDFAYAQVVSDVPSGSPGDLYAVQVDSLARLPSNQDLVDGDFWMTFSSDLPTGAFEIVKVLSTTALGSLVHVVRGQEGTAASGHPAGTYLQASITAAMWQRAFEYKRYVDLGNVSLAGVGQALTTLTRIFAAAAGSSDGSSAVAGLSIVFNFVVAALAGVATSTGTINRPVPVSAASAGAATSAGVAAPLRGLAGSSAGGSTGSLKSNTLLVASAAGVATASGDSTNFGMQLASSTAGLAAVAAALTRRQGVASSAAGVATVTGALTNLGQTLDASTVAQVAAQPYTGTVNTIAEGNGVIGALSSFVPSSNLTISGFRAGFYVIDAFQSASAAVSHTVRGSIMDTSYNVLATGVTTVSVDGRTAVPEFDFGKKIVLASGTTYLIAVDLFDNAADLLPPPAGNHLIQLAYSTMGSGVSQSAPIGSLGSAIIGIVNGFNTGSTATVMPDGVTWAQIVPSGATYHAQWTAGTATHDPFFDFTGAGIGRGPTALVNGVSASGTATVTGALTRRQGVASSSAGVATVTGALTNLGQSLSNVTPATSGISDNFTRANSSTSPGGPWTVRSGTYGITSNAGVLVTATGSNAAFTGAGEYDGFTADTGSVDIDCTWTVSKADSAEYQLLYFGYSPTTGQGYFLRWQNSGTCTLEKSTSAAAGGGRAFLTGPGGDSGAGISGLSGTGSHTVRITRTASDGTGAINVYIDSVLKRSCADTDLLAGTCVGWGTGNVFITPGNDKVTSIVAAAQPALAGTKGKAVVTGALTNLGQTLTNGAFPLFADDFNRSDAALTNPWVPGGAVVRSNKMGKATTADHSASGPLLAFTTDDVTFQWDQTVDTDTSVGNVMQIRLRRPVNTAGQDYYLLQFDFTTGGFQGLLYTDTTGAVTSEVSLGVGFIAAGSTHTFKVQLSGNTITLTMDGSVVSGLNNHSFTHDVRASTKRNMSYTFNGPTTTIDNFLVLSGSVAAIGPAAGVATVSGSLANLGQRLRAGSTKTAPTLDAASSTVVGAAGAGSATSSTWSHTVASGATALVVGIGGNNIVSLAASVTYNGVQMREVYTYVPAIGIVQAWILMNPPSGTHNIVVTYRGTAVFAMCSAQSFFNVGDYFGGQQANSGTGTVTDTGPAKLNDLNLGIGYLRTAPYAVTGTGAVSLVSLTANAGGIGSIMAYDPGSNVSPVTWGFTSGLDGAMVQFGLQGFPVPIGGTATVTGALGLLPTFDVGNGTTVTSTNAISWNHTCASDASTLLVALAYPDFGTTVSTLTYNGVAMTQQQSTHHSGLRLELWSLANPASGTNSISATLSTTEATIDGVSQSWRHASVGTSNSQSSISTASLSQSQSSAVGHAVAGFGMPATHPTNPITSPAGNHHDRTSTNGLSSDWAAGAATVTYTYQSAGGTTMGVATVDLVPA